MGIVPLTLVKLSPMQPVPTNMYTATNCNNILKTDRTDSCSLHLSFNIGERVIMFYQYRKLPTSRLTLLRDLARQITLASFIHLTCHTT